MRRAQAIAFTGKDRIELVDIAIPDPARDEILVETDLTAVSQGTDRAMVAGTYRGVADRYPFVYGYSRVGRVVETGDAVEGLAVGDRVFVGMAGTRLDPSSGFGELGGSYTSFGVVHHTDAVPLSEDVDGNLAALGAIAAVAYQGVAVSQVGANQRVLVAGLGAIGQFSALFSRLRGAQVWGSDPVESRRDLAARLSGALPIDPTRDIPGQIEASRRGSRPWPGRNDPPSSRYEQWRWSQAHGVVDVAIDATGRRDAFDAYVPLLAREGCLCLQGYYAEPLVFDFHAAHLKRLTIRCPGGFDQTDYETAIRLMTLVDVAPLVGQVIPIGDVPASLSALLAGGPTDVVAAVVDWRQDAAR
jgi:2-desacetyl-2-hydroxyethyl bacteriochlorophyllide A dehydrogenase